MADLRDVFKMKQSGDDYVTGADVVVSRVLFRDVLRRISVVFKLRRHFTPILSSVMITVEDHKMIVAGFDLESFTSDTIPATGTGKFLIPYRFAKQFASAAGGDQIAFFLDGAAIRMVSGCTSCKFKLKNVDDFPSLPAGVFIGEFRVKEVSRFIDDLCICSRFSGNDDSRKVLMQIHLKSSDGKLILSATDGKRLLMAQSAAFDGDFPPMHKCGDILIPAEFVPFIAGMFKNGNEIGIFIYENYLYFTNGTSCFRCKRNKGTFPNVEAVIPEGLDASIQLSGFALGWGIRSLCVQKESLLSLKIEDNQLEISHTSPDAGFSGTCNVPADTKEVKYESLIWFQHKFLSDLAALGESITMEFCNAVSPVMFTVDRYTCVIMPMRKG